MKHYAIYGYFEVFLDDALSMTDAVGYLVCDNVEVSSDVVKGTFFMHETIVKVIQSKYCYIYIYIYI